MKPKNIILAAISTLPIQCPSAFAQVWDYDSEYLGQLSASPYIADFTASKFGAFGSPLAEGNL